MLINGWAEETNLWITFSDRRTNSLIHAKDRRQKQQRQRLTNPQIELIVHGSIALSDTRLTLAMNIQNNVEHTFTDGRVTQVIPKKN